MANPDSLLTPEGQRIRRNVYMQHVVAIARRIPVEHLSSLGGFLSGSECGELVTSHEFRALLRVESMIRRLASLDVTTECAVLPRSPDEGRGR